MWNERVSFRLEEGRRVELDGNAPQLRHLDHAWASTVHAFQGRTVDNVSAAMEAHHPHLTTEKSFNVEISRARDRAELVTDDAQALSERLEAVTEEHVSALEGIGEAVARERTGREGSLREGRSGPQSGRRALSHRRGRGGSARSPRPWRPGGGAPSGETAWRASGASYYSKVSGFGRTGGGPPP